MLVPCQSNIRLVVWRRRHFFVKEVLSEVVERLSSNQKLKYSEILALDKKIRSFDADEAPRDQVDSNTPDVENNEQRRLRQSLDDISNGNG